MSQTTIISGLTKDDIVLLYKYLAFYEDNHIKTITKDQDLKTLFPNIITPIEELKKNIKFKQVAKGSISIANVKDLKNEIIYVKYHTITLSILYHLRNAIAHHLLKIANKECTFWDIDNNKTKNLTMYGVVKFEKIKNIIKSIL